MAKVTIVFGVVLLALGVGFYLVAGPGAPTSLIPAAFGLLLVLSGVLANTEDTGRRMLWMHIAVTVGLLGFLFPAFMAIKSVVKAHGGTLARPLAVTEQAVMAVICLIFTALCVQSFIAARRARAA